MRHLGLDAATSPPSSGDGGGDSGVAIEPEAPHVGEQQGLFLSDPERTSESSTPGSEAPRLFFPCNREDGLVLLGSLCISEFFPDAAVRLAVQADGIALVELGLRLCEEELLQAGQPERFPVLVEVRREANREAPRTVEYGHVVRLVFRTQDEADAFRFRPVDEFDTEVFECQADGACFGMEGPARFELRSADSSVAMRTGHVVDRLVAGIHCMLSLGEIQPVCRQAIGRFVAGNDVESAGGGEIDLAAACRTLTDAVQDDSSRHLRAIVKAFAEADNPTPRSLIDGISRNFQSLVADDAHAKEVESRWTEVARDVVRNKIPLNGDRLSDDKSVLLRGALLALVADGPEALSSFLDAERPSGPRVTSTAAFLVGLKQGLTNSSWKFKGRRASQLSAAAGGLLRAFAESRAGLERAVSLSRTEDDSTSFMRVSVGGVQLVEWRAEKAKAPDALEEAWMADFKRLGYGVVGKGGSGHSWMVAFPDSRVVEVVHCAVGTARFPMLRLNFESGQKLKKAKEIASNFGKGGHLWYPRSDEAGQFFLCCELPSLPDHRDVGLILDALREAIELCLAKAKPVRKGKKASTSSSPIGT